jgi:hypothetical protein
MTTGSKIASFPREQRRRSDRRRSVRPRELKGELRMNGQAWSVHIGDLPGSGAVVFTDHPPTVGSRLELWIEEFGGVPVEVVHSSKRLCGLVVTDAVMHRERLLTWLRYMLKTKAEDQPKDRRTPVFFCANITELASFRRK